MLNGNLVSSIMYSFRFKKNNIYMSPLVGRARESSQGREEAGSPQGKGSGRHSTSVADDACLERRIPYGVLGEVRALGVATVTGMMSP